MYWEINFPRGLHTDRVSLFDGNPSMSVDDHRKPPFVFHDLRPRALNNLRRSDNDFFEALSGHKTMSGFKRYNQRLRIENY